MNDDEQIVWFIAFNAALVGAAGAVNAGFDSWQIASNAGQIATRAVEELRARGVDLSKLRE